MEKRLEELLQEARYQLFHYPENSLEQNVKYYVKRLLRPANNPKRDPFFWPHAMLAQALETAGDIETLETYYDAWIKKGQEIRCIDNVMNGYSLLYVYEQTKKPKYKEAADKLYHYLKDYSQRFGGKIPYRPGNPTHIYADGVGMIVPFLCRYGKLFEEEEAVSMAVTYVRDFLKEGMDADTGLPYHGYDVKTGVKYGIIGWGRAVGWLMLGIEDALDYLPEGEDRTLFAKALKELIHSVRPYIREDGSLPWQLSAKEGPKDTSATAMVGYVMGKWLVPQDAVMTGMKAAIEISCKDGQIYHCSGECNGFGEYPQRYGAYPWSLGPGLRFLLDSFQE